MSVQARQISFDDRSQAETRTGRRLVGELDEIFGDATSAAVVSGYVYAAIRDLRGSVSQEALPEMAARLAQHRLSSRLTYRDPPAGGPRSSAG